MRAVRAGHMTDAELATVLALARRRGGGLANVGHGRDPASVAAARAFVAAWPGEIGAIVSWPATAASWLRPACRLAAGNPDVWVLADQAGAWQGMGNRLTRMPEWRPNRTIAFSGLACPALPDRMGDLDGLAGANPDGTAWSFHDGKLRVTPSSER
ncbi:hypothetical protein [Actinokineospora enzanensis]|uniref:hypothetical protein n=1 Tax=Actinokineospora enzanensis TaxID=155975 RepID=UPI001FE0639C|nr:hypothetical protein [Actinokineospora enzanensis]